MDIEGRTIEHRQTGTQFRVLSRHRFGYVVECVTLGSLPVDIGWAYSVGRRYTIALSTDVIQRSVDAQALSDAFQLVPLP